RLPGLFAQQTLSVSLSVGHMYAPPTQTRGHAGNRRLLFRLAPYTAIQPFTEDIQIGRSDRPCRKTGIVNRCDRSWSRIQITTSPTVTNRRDSMSGIGTRNTTSRSRIIE